MTGTMNHKQFISRPIRDKKYVYDKNVISQLQTRCICGSNTINMNKHIQSIIHINNIIKNDIKI